MELKAENDYTITEELFRESMALVVREDYMPSAKKLVIAMAVIWVLLAAITWRLGGRIIFILTELFVIGVGCLWVGVIAPKRRVSHTWDSIRNRGDTQRRHTCFYEDRMEVEPGGLIVNYEDVEKTLESEHMFIIETNEKIGIMICKDAFIRGDWPTVQALLEEWKR